MLHSGALGTLLYAAPEIIMGKEDYTETVDIYSWSIVINSILQEELPSSVNLESSGFGMKILPELIEGEEYKLYRELIERSKMNDPKERPSADEIVSKLLQKEAMLSDVNPIKIKQYQKEVLSNNSTISMILFQKINNLENENEKLNHLQKQNKKLIKSQNEQIDQLKKILDTVQISNDFIQSQINNFDESFENYPFHKDDEKFTKLHYATKIQNQEMLIYLISKRADINAIDIIYLNIIILLLINII